MAMNGPISQHKMLAMGKTLEDTQVMSTAGWPGGLCPPEKDDPLTRGVGRGPDAKKSGMSDPGNPMRAAFFEAKGA